MKKTIISSVFLFISVFVYGQKNLELSTTTSTNNETIKDDKLPRSRDLMQKSVAVTSYGAFHEIAGNFDYHTKAHLLLKETGGGYPTIRMIGTVSTPANDRFWDISGDVFGATVNDDYLFMSYGGTQTGFAISPNSKASIGLLQNTSNLHIHEPAAGTATLLKMTNGTIGSLTTDGLDIGINNFGNAYMINQEGGSIGISSGGGGITVRDANVGIGNPLVSATTGKLEVFHNTNNVATTPHINLHTNNNASNGMIRMESSNGSRYFGQYFNVNSATPANNFVSFDYNGSTPILDMQGNGNVKVSGFTTLGNDPAAPKIKMKKFTGNTALTDGASIEILHGLGNSKIVSMNLMVNYSGAAYVKENYTVAGYECNTYLGLGLVNFLGEVIYIVNKSGNSANILNKPYKLIVTYEE